MTSEESGRPTTAGAGLCGPNRVHALGTSPRSSTALRWYSDTTEWVRDLRWSAKPRATKRADHSGKENDHGRSLTPGPSVAPAGSGTTARSHAAEALRHLLGRRAASDLAYNEESYWLDFLDPLGANG